MRELAVGAEVDFTDDTRVFIDVAGIEIGILRHDGEYYAFENVCAHQGGPVCDGVVLPKVELMLAPDQTQHGQQFSEVDIHLVCPWHGWEYNIRTGVCAADPRHALQVFHVFARDGHVFLSFDETEETRPR